MNKHDNGDNANTNKNTNNDDNIFVVVDNDDHKGFYGRGPTWKRLRKHVQYDLLHPKSALGYFDGMNAVAKIASDAVPEKATRGTTRRIVVNIVVDIDIDTTSAPTAGTSIQDGETVGSR